VRESGNRSEGVEGSPPIADRLPTLRVLLFSPQGTQVEKDSLFLFYSIKEKIVKFVYLDQVFRKIDPIP
jgi:hypothetical protein